MSLGVTEQPNTTSTLSPDYLTRHAALIIEQVQVVDRSQQQIILQLLDDYDALCIANRDALSQDLGSFPTTGDIDQAVLQSQRATRRYIEEKSEHSKWLRENLRIILTAEQLPKFESTLRQINRDRLLPRGAIPVADTDLITLLNGAAVPRTPEINAILEQWALDIEQALAARESFDASNGLAFREMIAREQWREALNWRRSWLDSHRRVRDITIGASRDLMPLLDPTEAALLQREVLSGGINIKHDTIEAVNRALAASSPVEQNLIEVLEEFLSHIRPLEERLISLRLAAAGFQHLRSLETRLGEPVTLEPLDREALEVLHAIRQLDERYTLLVDRLTGS